MSTQGQEVGSDDREDCPVSKHYMHEVMGRVEERIAKGNNREIKYDRTGFTTLSGVTCSLGTHTVGTDICQLHRNQGWMLDATSQDRDRKAPNERGTHSCKN